MPLAVHRVLTLRPNILSCGFPKIAPPPTFTVCVLSGRLPKGASSASRCYTSDTFHPCRSSRLRWFTPQTAPQAYCILQPVMGFEPFLVGPPFRCVSTSVGPPSLSLVRSSHPSKRFPLWKPHHVTVTVAISLLHAPLFPAAFAHPHGFTPPESPLSSACVSACSRPDAPLGFVPLQGAPLVPSAHPDSPGVLPPQRLDSGPRSPK